MHFNFRGIQIKLCLCCALLVFSLLQPGVHAQRNNVSCPSVSKIIRYFESHYHCRFFYEENTLDLREKICLDLKNQTLDQLLNRFADRLSLTCKKMPDGLILLKRKTETKVNIRSVYGQVFNVATGKPLAGVKIVANGVYNIGESDAQGRFRLAIPPGTVELFFLLNEFRPYRSAVPPGDSLHVFMRGYQIDLDEVLVVGYGQQAVKNITGSIVSLNHQTILNHQDFSADQLLYGLPGIYVNKPGNQPGVNQINLNIRGLSSFNNSKPLVLVDGVEYQLGDLNPGDIQSISVLKDAASASIYGVKSANGVVVVKTRKGSDGKFRVEYDNNLGWQQVTYLPDAVWDPILYMELKNQALMNEGRAPDYTQEEIQEYADGMKSNSYVYPATNWFNLVFRKAFEQRHTLRMTIGKERYSVYTSLDFQDQRGVMSGSGSRKYALSLNTGYKLNSRMNLAINLRALSRTFNTPHMGVNDYMSYVTRSLPVYTAYLEDGRYGSSWVKTPGHNVFFHPLAHVDEGFNKTEEQRLMANVGLDIQLPAGFSYNANMSYNNGGKENKQFHPIVATYNPKTGEAQNSASERSAYRSTGSDKQIGLNHHLIWKESFLGGHQADILLGMSYLRNISTMYWASAEGFLNNKVTDLSAGTKNRKNGGTDYEDRLMSFYGRGRYNYRQKYLLEATLRVDGSSRFAAGGRWGIFPALALGWRMDQEPFMKNFNGLSLFKWRLSWGLLGNQDIDNYQYSESLESGKNYNFGDDIYPGVARTALFNRGITWEKTTVLNLGADIFLFANRLKLNGEVFHKRTFDILQRLMMAAQVGNLNGAIRNIGEIINKGYEIAFIYQDKVGMLNYSVGGNVSYVNNRVARMGENEIINGRFIVRDGYPVDSYYLLQADGLFRNGEEIREHAHQSHNTAPGDLRFRDTDENDVIDDNDRIITGKCFPDYTYGFSLNLRYKGLEGGMSWEGVSGVNTYPVGNLAMPFYNGAGITREWVSGSWTPENPDASLPRLMQASSGHDNYAKSSTFWLQDASYLRLKHVFVRYSFPDQWLDKLLLEEASVFISGQNLLTISEFSKFDPEKNLKNPNLYEYPSVKKWSVGIRVTFK